MARKTEEWKPYPSAPTKYEVSCRGRVRSLTRRKFGEPLIRAAQPDKDGYLRVSLFGRRDPRRGQYSIHKMVLETFVGPCPTGMECRHLNGKRDDNRVENLVWGTKEENISDRDRHGNNTAQGSTNPRAADNPNGERCAQPTKDGRCRARAYKSFDGYGWMCGTHQAAARRRGETLEVDETWERSCTTPN